MLKIYIFFLLYIVVEIIKREIIFIGFLNVKVKRDKKRYIMSAVIVAVMAYFEMNLKTDKYLTLMMIMTILSVLCLLSDQKKLKTVLMYVPTDSFVNVMDIILSFAVVNNLSNYSETLVFPGWKILIINYVNIVSLGLLYFLKRWITKKKLFEIPVQSYIIIGGACIPIMLIISLIQKITMGTNSEADIRAMILYLVLALIVIVVIALYVITILYEKKRLYDSNEMNIKYLELQEEYFLMNKKKDEDLRTFRHDAQSHVTAILHLIDKDDKQAARKYVADLIEGHTAEFDIDIGNAVVNSILNDFAKRAKNNEIEFHIVGRLPVEMSVRGVDLCVVFSNLLKNAMEAVMKLEDGQERFINVDIMNWEGRLMLEVKNPVTSKIDVNNMKTQKTDSKNHGLGIKSIKKSIEKYNGKLTFECDEQFFKAKVII